MEVIEKRQGLKIACLEGIAYRQGWISEEKMREVAQPMLKNQYGQYLLKVIEEVRRTGQGCSQSPVLKILRGKKIQENYGT